MNVLNIAKGLFIGGVFFVGLFCFINVQANRASAQAEVEDAQAIVEDLQALQAQIQSSQSEAEKSKARADYFLSELESDIRQSQLQQTTSPGRFQIVPWGANGRFGAYVLETETGKVSIIEGRESPTYIGQVE